MRPLTFTHSPLPWYCLKEEHNKAGHIIRSKPGKCEVARASEQFMSRGDRLANADFIVLACNHHEALVKVLEDALQELVGLDMRQELSDPGVCDRAAAILDKIKIDSDTPNS